jgi:sec-independent protein translocase protein TatA
MFGVGVQELLIILAILLLIFGATRLPKLARSMGQASKELREGLKRDVQNCAFCGAKLAADDKFCPGCGKSREEIAQEQDKQDQT